MSTFEMRACRAAPASRRPYPGNAHGVRPGRAGASGLQRAVTLLLIWRERARQRHQLQLLNDHMLRDIGLTRADVFAEASKPFWKP
jgi:uncharacterized protein YjiS (DUF1127 family)